MRISAEQWRATAKYFEFDGLRIAYWCQEKGIPLLLLHGFSAGAWDWSSIWKMPGTKHRLIAVDLIGFGLSDKPRSRCSIQRQTDMLLALLDHLGVSQFDVMAHAYGTSVAQELLARQQEGSAAANLNKLIFLNGGMFADEQRLRLIQRINASFLGFLTSKTLTRRQFDKNISLLFGDKTRPQEEELDDFWSFFSENDGHRKFHNNLRIVKDRHAHAERWIAALENAGDRIGLINGASDPISGEHSYRRWVDSLPDAKEYLLQEIGHYPHIEAPAEVASTTLEWLVAS
jgi:pimeloyl-ACP methyl ester carboxylesterase